MNYMFVNGIGRDGLAYLENEKGVRVPVRITEIESRGYPPSMTYKCEEIVLFSKEHMSMKKDRQLAINVTITKVIFNDPATIVFWSDGTKTVVKTQNGEQFDPEKGLAMAIAKRAFGNKGNYYNHISNWVDKYNEDQEALRKLRGLFDRFDEGIVLLREKLSKTEDEKMHPIISPKVCSHCKWYFHNNECRSHIDCEGCAHQDESGTCYCLKQKIGEPCRYFEEEGDKYDLPTKA